MQKIWQQIHPPISLKYLNGWDLVILALIFFGDAIWISTEALMDGTAGDPEMLNVSAADNWNAILGICWILLGAAAYLWFRHFDWKQLKMKLEWSLFWKPILIYLGAAIVCDFSFLLLGLIPALQLEFTPLNYLSDLRFDWETLWGNFTYLDVSTILFSLVNGFYEEVFFLGLLLSTRMERRRWVLLFSSLVRVSFHTYQTIPVALVIGISYGLFFYYIYTRKDQNILQCSLAHAYGDMVGINLFFLFVSM
ncbi:CPBP family intramembrane glutamic endopeptidase [Streptococcus sp. NLN64]|uniref:CPBP family intramembrane glutamic endopeptidase n=1 Tax=Streptococcus sp. NLN64 TaxID=2822799 RepID=UPI0018C96B8B|nr:CPBP family intramembrane glutamic endopeptidase [Streptococcus sp. NLN64]MBG9367080.1 CPBP family intramembrane metalloprotease [Streptococcus sp. NLN64]